MNNNLIGQVFDRLTVLEDSLKRKPNGSIIWKCICECGNIHYVAGSYLLDGRTKSCGCIRREIMSTQRYTLMLENQAAYNILYKNYRNNAKYRNIEFDLTDDEFRLLTQNNCYYCGKEPAQLCNSTTGAYIYNGIDRVDNSQGYNLGNCVACCGECNRLKRNITVDMCRKVIAFVDEEKER